MNYFEFTEELKNRFTKEGLIDFISNYDTYMSGRYVDVVKFYEEFYPRQITSGQIKAIHTIASLIGWDTDKYKNVLESLFDVTTCKELTEKQASQLIDVLKVFQKEEV